ncbi:MAG: efflux RND transporter periplasmic adaptor subunit [Porphyromonas sp.]|nr:efflux RND transporter periplasmic adaptor subunit [Porphyromonas sp.]
MTAALSSCKGGGRAKEGNATAGAIYTVRVIQPEKVTVYESYPATLRGKLDVEIRPQVGGPITQLTVDEGDKVRKGQTLFVLDQVQYQEAVNAAKAAVEVATSVVATARLTAENNRQLANEKIIGGYALQTAENNLASAEAGLAQAKAQLTSAEKQLSYTRITSPTDGVVGNIPYRVGSLVSPTNPQPLTIVSDISEMYAHFSVTERQVLGFSHSGESIRGALESLPELQLELIDGSTYEHTGKVQTISGVLDPITGSLNVRVLFPNPDGKLLSGSTGNVMIPNTIEEAIEVPQLATFQLQHNTYVYVIDDQNVARATQIEILPLNDGKNYIVTTGLKSGDKVVIDGVVTLKEGMTVEYTVEDKK